MNCDCLCYVELFQVFVVNSVVSDGVEVPNQGYMANCRITSRVKIADGMLLSGVNCSLHQVMNSATGHSSVVVLLWLHLPTYYVLLS